MQAKESIPTEESVTIKENISTKESSTHERTGGRSYVVPENNLEQSIPKIVRSFMGRYSDEDRYSGDSSSQIIMCRSSQITKRGHPRLKSKPEVVS